MGISFSGLASGMDTSSWVEALVSVKQSAIKDLNTDYSLLQKSKTTLNNVKSTFSSFLTATQKFTDSQYGVSKDVFAKKTVSSSNKSAISALVTNSTPRQTLSIQIGQLATATKVTSANSVASPIDENTKVSELASGAVKAGTLSLYVDNARYSIEVKEDDTLGDIAKKFEEAASVDGVSLVEASFTENGEFQIKAVDGMSVVRVGSNADSSTLANALALNTDENGVVKSSHSISAVNVTKPLTSVESGFFTYDEETGEKIPLIKAGDFKIGDATITITESTTMNELISKINSSTTAKAEAVFDSVENKLVITSKQEGSFNLNIEAGTSNFTDVMRLTENGKIISSTQKLGQNAELTINGSKIQSYSNTITSEVSGVPGLTLNLLDIPKETESQTITISIGQDTDSIINEVKSLFTSLNNLISKTDTATGEKGDLQYESRLNNLRNTLRSDASSKISDDGIYKTLASIGITTGAFGTSVEADTNSFKVDESTLRKALEENPDAVRELLVGDFSKGTTGLVQKLQTTVNHALNTENGYFATRLESLDSQMKNLNDKISLKTEQMYTYQERLEKKFQNMELMIAELQNDFSKMSSVLSV